MRPLVLGLGRLEAGDDAAGRLVARGLAGGLALGLAGAAEFDVEECEGGATEIMAHLAGRSRVVIVDACRSGAAVGTILRRDAGEGVPVAPARSSHGLGLAEALELARALGQLPAECRLWLIEGGDFGMGAGISPAVARAVDETVAGIPMVLDGLG